MEIVLHNKDVKGFVRNIKKIVIVIFVSIFSGTFLLSSANAATFYINPKNSTIERGCARSVDVLINVTGESANAAEVEISYDPSKISIIDSNEGVAGKQIQIGNAFESYFFNEVNESTGTIKLAGASFFSVLTSEKTFATINFTSIGNVTSSDFNIRFDGVGETQDSNIAQSESNVDILSGVVNGTVNFIDGPCEADTTAPLVNFITPTNGAKDVPLDSNIVITITDTESGLDLDSLEFVVNGVTYTVSDPNVTYVLNGDTYTFTIDPVDDFYENSASVISVNGADLAGNTFSKQIIFNQPVVEPAPRDNESPVVNFINPINLETNVGGTETITLKIFDDSSGVNIQSVTIYVNGQAFNFNDFNYSGDPLEYLISLYGSGIILENQVNTLRITGVDFTNNYFDVQIIFNIPLQQECEEPVVDDNQDDQGEDNNNQDDVPVNDILLPGISDIIDDLNENPDQLEDQVKNCYGEELEFKEVPTIFREILSSENPFEGTPLADTAVADLVRETGVSGFAALMSVLLFGMNLLPLLTLILGTPGIGLKMLTTLLGKKHDEPWGVIVDASTRKPVPFAVCEIYSEGSQYKLTQSVSDLEGRYGFILSDGRYRLEIKQSGYKTFNKEIIIRDKQSSLIIDVELIPVDKTIEYKERRLKKIWSGFKYYYARFSKAVFIFGFLFSFISLFLSFGIFNLIVFTVYTLIMLSFVLPEFNKRDKFASVINSENGLRVPFVQVKIYDPVTWKLVDSVITNFNGQFDFFGEGGDYAILVVARGYEFPSKLNKFKTSKEYNSMILVPLSKGKNKIEIFVDPKSESSKSKNQSSNIDSPFS